MSDDCQIVGVYLSMLRASAAAANHAVHMFESAPSGDNGTRGNRARILYDAGVIAQAAAAAMDAAVSISALTEYRLAADIAARPLRPNTATCSIEQVR